LIKRELVLSDIKAFSEAISEMYVIDSYVVYECVHSGGHECDLGYKITKDGKEFIIASTYLVQLGGNMKQKYLTNRMMATSDGVTVKLNTIGECMHHLGIELKDPSKKSNLLDSQTPFEKDEVVEFVADGMVFDVTILEIRDVGWDKLGHKITPVHGIINQLNSTWVAKDRLIKKEEK
jgi:hypothetical protein